MRTPSVALLLSVSCASEAVVTEVVVVIDSELRSPGVVDRLVLGGIPSGDLGEPFGSLPSIDIELDGTHSFPITHSIQRTSDETPTISLALIGLKGDSVVALTGAVATFVPSQSRAVVLHLTESCLGIACFANTRSENDFFYCQDGRCVQADYGADTSVRWEGAEPPVEGCDRLDNDADGAVDEGIDLQSSALDCGACGQVCAGGPCIRGVCESTPVASISAGRDHSCALHESGNVTCWGPLDSPATGQTDLGPGGRARPRAVTLVQQATAISAGAGHTCATLASGSIVCWGDNSTGQLGDGTFVAGFEPRPVIGINGATQVAAGDAHTCALTGAGRVSCWGATTDGRLGRTVRTAAADPVPGEVEGLVGATRVGAGKKHTCAIAGADVYCWGANEWGQAGVADEMDATPVEVPFATRVDSVAARDIALGSEHTCIASVDEQWQCWGIIGLVFSPRPTAVPGVAEVVGVASRSTDDSVFGDVACAVTRAGTVYCMGSNEYGQIQQLELDSVDTPERMSGLSGPVIQVATGFKHACALTSERAVECWGINLDGQLGNWSAEPSPQDRSTDIYRVPVRVLAP